MLPWQPFFGFLYIGATWRIRLNVSMCCGDAALCQITWPLVLFELMPFCCVLLCPVGMQSIVMCLCLSVCSLACRFGRLLGWSTIYTFSGLLPPDGILPGAEFTLHPSLAFSYIGSVTARHFSIGRQPNCGMVQGMELRNCCRGCHLYWAGRPSRLASAHILVVNIFRRNSNL